MINEIMLQKLEITEAVVQTPLARLCRFALQRTPPDSGGEEITGLIH